MKTRKITKEEAKLVYLLAYEENAKFGQFGHEFTYFLAFFSLRGLNNAMM